MKTAPETLLDAIGQMQFDNLSDITKGQIYWAMEQYASQQGWWISVEERLPEVQVPVLILTDYGKQATALLYDQTKPTYGWIDWMRQEHSYGSVTHWQPLPPPPREEGGK